MTAILDEQGHIILPKEMRDALGLEPGTKFVLDADERGELYLRPERIAKDADPDRFEKAIGILEPWPGGTDAYMALLRGDDE